MSTTAAAPAITPHEVEAARELVFKEAWAGAFFSKLAELGHVGQTDQERQALIDIADYIAVNDNSQKQASVGPYSELRNMLASHLGHGPQQQRSQAKQAAAGMLAQPALYNAVLTIKLAEAQAV